MDHLDEKILRELRADGRLSNLQLSEHIGLSPSATSRRVAELERRGVIAGYRAIVDAKKAGREFVTYITVRLSLHTKEAQRNFERVMDAAEEVAECHSVAGEFEYFLRVETADLESYKRFHTDVLGTVPHVSSFTSFIVLESTKDRRA